MTWIFWFVGICSTWHAFSDGSQVFNQKEMSCPNCRREIDANDLHDERGKTRGSFKLSLTQTRAPVHFLRRQTWQHWVFRTGQRLAKTISWTSSQARVAISCLCGGTSVPALWFSFLQRRGPETVQTQWYQACIARLAFQKLYFETHMGFFPGITARFGLAPWYHATQIDR